MAITEDQVEKALALWYSFDYFAYLSPFMLALKNRKYFFSLQPAGSLMVDGDEELSVLLFEYPPDVNFDAFDAGLEDIATDGKLLSYGNFLLNILSVSRAK